MTSPASNTVEEPSGSKIKKSSMSYGVATAAYIDIGQHITVKISISMQSGICISGWYTRTMPDSVRRSRQWGVLTGLYPVVQVLSKHYCSSSACIRYTHCGQINALWLVWGRIWLV